MQGGYQLLDFGNFKLDLNDNDRIITIPFNIRDYVGKQIRISGLVMAFEDDIRLDADSIITFNTTISNSGVSLTSIVSDAGGDITVISIEQLKEYEDFTARIYYVTI